jgi:hypothetical protein
MNLVHTKSKVNGRHVTLYTASTNVPPDFSKPDHEWHDDRTT